MCLPVQLHNLFGYPFTNHCGRFIWVKYVSFYPRLSTCLIMWMPVISDGRWALDYYQLSYLTVIFGGKYKQGPAGKLRACIKEVFSWHFRIRPWCAGNVQTNSRLRQASKSSINSVAQFTSLQDALHVGLIEEGCDQSMIAGLERCTQQFVHLAVMRLRYHSSPALADPYIVAIATPLFEALSNSSFVI